MSDGPPTRACRTGTTPTACPTSSAWSGASPATTTAAPPGPEARASTAATTVRWCWSGDRPPTRCSRPSCKPPSRPATPGPSTSTATARRASPAFDRNVHRGRRLSAARAYLHPVLNRPNLHLLTRAFTTRVLFEGTRATGVEYTKGGRSRTVNAGEVICCGGAINSPQLLQLSGVGPAGLLRRYGIDVVADLPAVGANMQDHLEVYIQYACKQPVSMQPNLAKWRRPLIGLQWLARRGPGATNHFEAGGFIRSNDEVPYPNLMFHFLPIAIRYDGSVPEGGHGYQVHVGPMYSNSRGTVAIVSARPSHQAGAALQLPVHR